MIVSNFEEYQPRFRAWLRSLNAKDGDDVKTYEYIIWNGRKCAEFQKANGITFLNDEGHRKFTEWLFEEAERECSHTVNV
jgi:hypothetical protein